MGADDARTALGRDHMRGDRAGQALMRLRRRDRRDEKFSRGADQERQAEATKFFQPRQRGQALLLGLAEADAGIEHDVLSGNAGSSGNVERAGEEGGDLLYDVD